MFARREVNDAFRRLIAAEVDLAEGHLRHGLPLVHWMPPEFQLDPGHRIDGVTDIEEIVPVGAEQRFHQKKIVLLLPDQPKSSGNRSDEFIGDLLCRKLHRVSSTNKVFCNVPSNHAESPSQILQICFLGRDEPLLHGFGRIVPHAFGFPTNPELDTGRLYTERAGKTLPPGVDL